MQTTKPSVTVTLSFSPMELLEDNLAVEIEDEYDPMVPNSYEQVLNERREERAKAREEVPNIFVRGAALCDYLVLSFDDLF